MNNKDTKRNLDSFTEENLSALKSVALAASLGRTYILELTTTANGRHKYVPLKDPTPERIEEALDWIAEHGNEFGQYVEDEDGNQSGLFILQQEKPDHRFWESLIARSAGKPTKEVKVSQEVRLIEELAEKAAEKNKKKKNNRFKDMANAAGAIPSSLLFEEDDE